MMIVAEDTLTAWAEECIHINHLNTLIAREIDAGNLKRAPELSRRAQRRAWKMLNELFEKGAAKPEGWLEAGERP